MDSLTRAFLTAPPPLRDPGCRLDRIAAITGCDGDRFEAVTDAGALVVGRLSSPAAGVLRLQLATGAPALERARHRWAHSPMLAPGLGDMAMTCSLVDGALIGTAPGLSPFRWAPADDGLTWGVMRSSTRAHTLIGPNTETGRLLGGPGDRSGWLLSLRLAADEAIYGGGESFQGPDLRGRVRHCVNTEVHGAAGLDQSYLTVPFFWTDGGWGCYLHTGTPLRADLAATHPAVMALELPDEAADLFCYQGDAEAILTAHCRVTGLPGGVPDWAFGVWTSRCSYLNADEVMDVLDGYERADCPVDVVHVDAWQRGDVIADLSTNWEVDRDRWPTGWSTALAERGVRLSLWHNPYLRLDTTAGKEARSAGLLMRDDDGELLPTNDLPDRYLIDFTDPAALGWWHARVTGLLAGEGASSVKPDFAEEVPPTARLADGRTGWELRNEYALRYQAASAQALREITGSGDAVMFCRSGTAGAQRYPGHWVGDTPSTWEGMAAALRACQALSLSGFSLVGSDVGGFWTPAGFAALERACRDNDPDCYLADVDPELFVRWAQWGSLSPLMRFHGTGRREPWAYPDPFGSVAVQACRLRARLHGYLARTARTATESGLPMMRPMPLAYPGDRAARDATLQYLLGPDLLVAPVLQPGGRLRVWVPPGDWPALHGAPDLSGPGWVSLDLQLDAIPAWCRAGTTLERAS